MIYRGIQNKHDPKKRLADWMFHDFEFPKHTSDYDEISRYLEWNPPFPEAAALFDELWEQYENE